MARSPNAAASAATRFAKSPNSKLMGPVKWSCFHLYAIPDIFSRRFFAWYNEDHHHAGIGLMTPDQIHFGQACTIDAARQIALDAAFLSTPERFVRKRPKPPQIPTDVWINPPTKTEQTQA